MSAKPGDRALVGDLLGDLDLKRPLVGDLEADLSGDDGRMTLVDSSGSPTSSANELSASLMTS